MNSSMNRYILAKQNYTKLLGSQFQTGGDDNLFDRLLANYVYQRGLNDNDGHREFVIDGKKYSTIYGEIFTEDANGLNSLKVFINIAKHYGVDFFGDIGSGRGMLPAALNDSVKKSFGVEFLATRHGEAVKFMNDVLNVDNSWNIKKSHFPDALGNAVGTIPKDINDPSKYMNRVIFKHNMNGKELEYLNGDMLFVDWSNILKGYDKGMFWISNLCFPELTQDLFAKFKSTLPVGTIVILSRAPKDVEQYGFRLMHKPEVGINNGKLSLAQTWNNNDYADCVEFVGSN